MLPAIHDRWASRPHSRSSAGLIVVAPESPYPAAPAGGSYAGADGGTAGGGGGVGLP